MKKVKFKIKIGIRSKGDVVEYEDTIADGMKKHGFADIIGDSEPKAKAERTPVSRKSIKKQ